jgi:hypothetical protein
VLAERDRWDLALIDGDHAYESVSADFGLMRRVGTRMIALHDTVDVGCPGVERFWREIRGRLSEECEFVEFTQQYPDVCQWTCRTHFGIGVSIASETGRLLG